jgi:hypothetical protein
LLQGRAGLLNFQHPCLCAVNSASLLALLHWHLVSEKSDERTHVVQIVKATAETASRFKILSSVRPAPESADCKMEAFFPLAGGPSQAISSLEPEVCLVMLLSLSDSPVA